MDTYYAERQRRARELHGSGKKVLGYFCCFVPLELLTAFDIVPYRIQGNVREPIDRADACLEPMSCPYVRSCLDIALKGSYEFLDGLVVPHSCDTIEKIYDIWKYHLKPSYSHFLNVPHMLTADAHQFFKKELETFVASLEGFTGLKMTAERLRRAIHLHNENRSLLRQLYELRKAQPPMVSGVEVIRMLIAGMGMPVADYSDMVNSFIADVSDRLPDSHKLPRILLYGAELDDAAFIKLVEDSGAHVVVDDLCTGTRTFWQDVEITTDPLDGIVKRYLSIYCPRSYIAQGSTREKDLDNRFGYLGRYVRDFKVDGAILYILRYCDTYEMDAPDVRDFLRNQGIPVLILEDDYTLTSSGQLRTRIQAFLEMIS